MSVPTVYRWDDPSAPQITDCGNTAQILAWLQAVCETGYGAKPAMGWTVYNPSTNVIGLEQGGVGYKTNMGVYLDFTQRVVNNYVEVGVAAGDTWNGGSIGGAWMNVDPDNQYFGPMGSDGYVLPWVIIGNERSMYVIGGYNSNTPTGVPTALTNIFRVFVNFFGDYNNYVDVNGYNQAAHPSSSQFALNGAYTSSTYYNVASETFFKNNFNSLARRLGGKLQTQNYGPYETDVIGNPSKPLAYPYIDGNTYLMPLELYGTSDNIIYGSLPGAYHAKHSFPFGTPSGISEFVGSGPLDGKNMVCISGTADGEFYIDVSSDWEA